MNVFPVRLDFLIVFGTDNQGSFSYLLKLLYSFLSFRLSIFLIKKNGILVIDFIISRTLCVNENKTKRIDTPTVPKFKDNFKGSDKERCVHVLSI